MLGIGPPTPLAIAVATKAYASVEHWIDSLDRQGWFLVLCGAVVVGFFCLRGFGSRSNY